MTKSRSDDPKRFAADLPRVPWCAVGFGAAGSGVGSIVGMAKGSVVWTALSPEEQAGLSSTGVVYLWMWRGIFLGVALGAVVGIAYAMTVRRLLLARWMR